MFKEYINTVMLMVLIGGFSGFFMVCSGTRKTIFLIMGSVAGAMVGMWGGHLMFNAEVDALAYMNVTDEAKTDCKVAQMLREAMADRKMTRREYNVILDEITYRNIETARNEAMEQPTAPCRPYGKRAAA